MTHFRFRRYLFDSLNFAFIGMVLFLLIQGPSEEEILNKLYFYGYLTLGLTILGIGVSEFFFQKKIRTLGQVIFAAPADKHRGVGGPLLKSLWGLQLLFSVAIAFWVSALVTKTNIFELIDEKGLAGALNLFSALLNPNWTILPQAIYNVFVTIFMAFLSTALAVPIAFVLSFLCAKNIMRHPAAMALYFVLRTILNFMRSIEALIWAIIFSVWVGIGPYAGMLALMIHSIASLAKQYSEMVESVEDGPIEGVLSTGAGFFQTIWFSIVPQVILPYISFTVYRWDTNVRMATIIGFVGGGGIGTMLLKYQGQAMWNEVGTIVLVIAVVVWSMDQASALIRDALK